jgi:hypothetical protein
MGVPFQCLGPNAVFQLVFRWSGTLFRVRPWPYSVLCNPQLGSRLSQRLPPTLVGVTKPPRQQDFSVWRLAAALMGVIRGPNSRIMALGRVAESLVMNKCNIRRKPHKDDGKGLPFDGSTLNSTLNLNCDDNFKNKNLDFFAAKLMRKSY